MINTIKIILLAISLMAFVIACNKESGEKKQVASNPQMLNPNGDSELAILMRNMADEAERIKAYVENGETPEIEVDYQQILSATATEPHKKATPEYKAFAEAHIQSMQLLEDADTSRMLTLYDNMVDNCINCHKALCPGPLVRIKKLKIPAKQL